MTNKTTADIEEAAKQAFESREPLRSIIEHAANNWQVNTGWTELLTEINYLCNENNEFKDRLDAIESHTAAHTASLRGDNAKLAHFNEVINAECTRIRIELGEEGGRVAALREENTRFKKAFADA